MHRMRRWLTVLVVGGVLSLALPAPLAQAGSAKTPPAPKTPAPKTPDPKTPAPKAPAPKATPAPARGETVYLTLTGLG